MERLLFEDSQPSKDIKMNLTQKYFNRLYELIKQQNDVKVIITPMDFGDIKIDPKTVNDKSNYWYS